MLCVLFYSFLIKVISLLNLLVNEQMIEILLSIIGIGIFIALIVIIYQNSKKKWKCIEGKCEPDINGEYTSKSNCKNNCKEKSLSTTLENESQENTPWACTNNYKCIQSNQGIYTTEEACRSNCNAPDPTPNYYPQSMIPFWRPYRRPYYWPHRKPHRHHSPHKHH